MPERHPLVSVIVPVHNGSAVLERCLAALVKSSYCAVELIVVDDSSTESIAPLVELAGARLIRVDGGPFGPARARNRGARAASGEILFFTDADVEVHPDTIGHAVDALRDPAIDAVFGSYDLEPGDPSFLSQYKNLFHHFVHQHAGERAGTFWSGCGAIRREVFLETGGFDDSYRRPSIEDIEYGVRLRHAGYEIRLVKAMQVRHLKRWTFWGLIHTEIFDRGVPWTVLIMQTRELPADLNLKPRERTSALLTLGLVGSLALAPFWPAALIVTGILAALFCWLNVALYRFFAQARGLWFAIRAVPMHLLYYLYSTASFGIGVLTFLFGRRPPADPIPARRIKAEG